MAKVFVDYTTDTGVLFAVAQEAAVQAGVGNTVSAVNISRLPDKIKPRRVSIRLGGGKYLHPVVGGINYNGLTPGQTILGGPICGFDGEVNNGFTS